jgi:hypothetical protein
VSSLSTSRLNCSFGISLALHPGCTIKVLALKDFEVILLDDASTDGSVPMFEKFARRKSWRLVINQSNSGSPFKQWNKGLRLTTGKYLCTISLPMDVRSAFVFCYAKNTIQNASAVLFRRKLFDVVGGVDEELSLNADWKFWASLLLNSDVAFVAEPLNSFRFHRNTVRSRTKKWETVLQSMEVMRFIVNGIDVPIDAMQDLHARLA